MSTAISSSVAVVPQEQASSSSSSIVQAPKKVIIQRMRQEQEAREAAGLQDKKTEESEESEEEDLLLPSPLSVGSYLKDEEAIKGVLSPFSPGAISNLGNVFSPNQLLSPSTPGSVLPPLSVKSQGSVDDKYKGVGSYDSGKATTPKSNSSASTSIGQNGHTKSVDSLSNEKNGDSGLEMSPGHKSGRKSVDSDCVSSPPGSVMSEMSIEDRELTLEEQRLLLMELRQRRKVMKEMGKELPSTVAQLPISPGKGAGKGKGGKGFKGSPSSGKSSKDTSLNLPGSIPSPYGKNGKVQGKSGSALQAGINHQYAERHDQPVDYSIGKGKGKDYNNGSDGDKDREDEDKIKHVEPRKKRHKGKDISIYLQQYQQQQLEEERRKEQQRVEEQQRLERVQQEYIVRQRRERLLEEERREREYQRYIQEKQKQAERDRLERLRRERMREKMEQDDKVYEIERFRRTSVEQDYKYGSRTQGPVGSPLMERSPVSPYLERSPVSQMALFERDRRLKSERGEPYDFHGSPSMPVSRNSVSSSYGNQMSSSDYNTWQGSPVSSQSRRHSSVGENGYSYHMSPHASPRSVHNQHSETSRSRYSQGHPMEYSPAHSYHSSEQSSPLMPQHHMPEPRNMHYNYPPSPNHSNTNIGQMDHDGPPAHDISPVSPILHTMMRAASIISHPTQATNPPPPLLSISDEKMFQPDRPKSIQSSIPPHSSPMLNSHGTSASQIAPPSPPLAPPAPPPAPDSSFDTSNPFESSNILQGQDVLMVEEVQDKGALGDLGLEGLYDPKLQIKVEQGEYEGDQCGHVDENSQGLEESQVCQVCGDIAAGFHCGAYVCEACKKFFVRCIKSEQSPKFLCPRTKNCSISKETRTQCQYCRYQKCLTLGMYKPGGTNISAEIGHIPCKVCGAPSSGYHFGAITCEGCKGFFRRTVKERDSMKYQCSRSGNCTITVTTRNVCKFCRYKKCLDVGMKADGSRIGRQPNAIKHATMIELNQIKVAKGLSATFDIHTKSEPSTPTSMPPDVKIPPPQSSQSPAHIPPSSPCVPMPSPSKQSPSTIRYNNNQAHAYSNPTTPGLPLHSPIREQPNYHQSPLNYPQQSPHSHTFPSPHPSPLHYPSSLPSPIHHPSPLPSPNHHPAYPSPSRQSGYNYPPPVPSPSHPYQNVGNHTLPPSPGLVQGQNMMVDCTSPAYPPYTTPPQQYSSPCPSPSIGQGPAAVSQKPVCASPNHNQMSKNPATPTAESETGTKKTAPRYTGLELDAPIDSVIEVVSRASKELKVIRSRSSKILERFDSTLGRQETWECMMGQFTACAFGTLKFAKKIPGFRKLDVSTQITVLQKTMYPIVLTILSLDYDNKTQTFNYFTFPDEERDTVLMHFPDFKLLLPTFHNVGSSVSALHLDETEAGLLCAMLLLSEPQIADFQELLLVALEEYCQGKYGDPSRAGTIALRLCELARANAMHQSAVMGMAMNPANQDLAMPQLFQETYLND